MDEEDPLTPDGAKPGVQASGRLDLGQVIEGIVAELDELPEQLRIDLKAAAAEPEARRVRAVRRVIERHASNPTAPAPRENNG